MSEERRADKVGAAGAGGIGAMAETAGLRELFLASRSSFGSSLLGVRLLRMGIRNENGADGNDQDGCRSKFGGANRFGRLTRLRHGYPLAETARRIVTAYKLDGKIDSAVSIQEDEERRHSEPIFDRSTLI